MYLHHQYYSMKQLNFEEITNYKTLEGTISWLCETLLISFGPLLFQFWISDDVFSGSQKECGSIACGLRHLRVMDSSDSLQVWHLLNSWRSGWQLSPFTYLFFQVSMGVELLPLCGRHSLWPTELFGFGFIPFCHGWTEYANIVNFSFASTNHFLAILVSR